MAKKKACPFIALAALMFSGSSGHLLISSFKSSGKFLGTHRAHFLCNKVSKQCL